MCLLLKTIKKKSRTFWYGFEISYHTVSPSHKERENEQMNKWQKKVGKQVPASQHYKGYVMV